MWRSFSILLTMLFALLLSAGPATGGPADVLALSAPTADIGIPPDLSVAVIIIDFKSFEKTALTGIVVKETVKHRPEVATKDQMIPKIRDRPTQVSTEYLNFMIQI